MATALDPNTVFVMSNIIGGAMSVVLYSAHRSFPEEIKGLGHWAAGLLLLVIGAACYKVRMMGLLPDMLMATASTATVLWGLGLTAIGTQVFYGRPPNWRLFHLVWIAGMCGIFFFFLVQPDFAMRLAVLSFLALGLYACQLELIVRYGSPHFSTWMFGVLMFVQAMVVLTRGVLALVAGGSGSAFDLLQPGPLQSIYLALGHFMALALTVTFMTVATRRLQIILERRSTYDPLTQVLNRRGFADVYARERARLLREPGVMAMLSIDVDFFKSINDCHGHGMGDRVLIDIAAVIGNAVRQTDHVARFGGEEFVVLLPDTGLERARAVAERIQSVLGAPRAQVQVAPPLPAYTVSIGIASQLDPNEDLDGLLQRADRALYRAKENGRNRIEFAEPAAVPLLRPGQGAQLEAVVAVKQEGLREHQ